MSNIAKTLSPAAAFFFEHAGFSYDPITETRDQGRTRGAIALAEAEALYLEAHAWADVVCAWTDDPDAENDWRLDKKHGRVTGKKPKTFESCGIHDADGNCLASLWGIEDADANYRRVVRAELASECADELRAIIAACREGEEV